MKITTIKSMAQNNVCNKNKLYTLNKKIIIIRAIPNQTLEIKTSRHVNKTRNGPCLHTV
jgi:hypothetical protein